jgi:hypothetical protein
VPSNSSCQTISQGSSRALAAYLQGAQDRLHRGYVEVNVQFPVGDGDTGHRDRECRADLAALYGSLGEVRRAVACLVSRTTDVYGPDDIAGICYLRLGDGNQDYDYRRPAVG